MKTIFKLTSVILFLLVYQTFSQTNLNTYRVPDLSMGKSLVVFGNPLLSYDASDSKNNTFAFDLEGAFTYWKLTPKKGIGAYADGFIRSKSTKSNDTSKTSSSFGGDAYGGMSYYFKQNKLYAMGSAGLSYLKNIVDSISHQAFIPMFLWAGVGYGRIVNAERVVVASDMQESLKKFGITKENLSASGLAKLTNLLDRRANGEFIVKYKDNADIEFFSQLEDLLRSEKLIDGTLDARSALKLVQVLTDPSYIYYPRYTGWQAQAELQLQVYSGTSGVKATEHYLSFSGVYGKPLNMKTQVVGSAFLSFALNSQASGMAPGFFPYLNFIPDRTSLDFYSQSFGAGLYGGHYTPGKTIYFGFRGDVFHSISSFAGAHGYAEFISSKPSGTNATNKLEAGARIDYNILAKLVAYGQARWTKITKLDASYNLEVGFTYYVF